MRWPKCGMQRPKLCAVHILGQTQIALVTVCSKQTKVTADVLLAPILRGTRTADGEPVGEWTAARERPGTLASTFSNAVTSGGRHLTDGQGNDRQMEDLSGTEHARHHWQNLSVH